MRERVSWFYHRKGCRGSRLARRFLNSRGCVVAEEVDASAAAVKARAAVNLIKQVSKLVVAWRGEVLTWELVGGKWVKFRIWKQVRRIRGQGIDAPHGAAVEESDILYYILRGRFLRTPALRKGGTLLVGFSDDAAKCVFRG